MGGEGYGCAQQCGQELVFGRKLAGRLVGEQSGDGNADESVQGVPEQVEGGNLVGEEFDDKEHDARGDYRPGLEQVQAGGKWEMSEAGDEAEDGDGGVEIESGGETDG